MNTVEMIIFLDGASVKIISQSSISGSGHLRQFCWQVTARSWTRTQHEYSSSGSGTPDVDLKRSYSVPARTLTGTQLRSGYSSGLSVPQGVNPRKEIPEDHYAHSDSNDGIDDHLPDDLDMTAESPHSSLAKPQYYLPEGHEMEYGEREFLMSANSMKETQDWRRSINRAITGISINKQLRQALNSQIILAGKSRSLEIKEPENVDDSSSDDESDEDPKLSVPVFSRGMNSTSPKQLSRPIVKLKNQAKENRPRSSTYDEIKEDEPLLSRAALQDRITKADYATSPASAPHNESGNSHSQPVSPVAGRRQKSPPPSNSYTNSESRLRKNGAVLHRQWVSPTTLDEVDSPLNQPIKRGILYLRKSSGAKLAGGTKTRWALLTETSLAFIKTSKKGIPTESICLLAATLSIPYMKSPNDKKSSLRKSRKKDKKNLRHQTLNKQRNIRLDSNSDSIDERKQVTFQDDRENSLSARPGTPPVPDLKANRKKTDDFTGLSFQIETNLWVKRGEVKRTQRTFIISTPTVRDTTEWIDAILNVIQTHEDFLMKNTMFSSYVMMDGHDGSDSGASNAPKRNSTPHSTVSDRSGGSPFSVLDILDSALDNFEKRTMTEIKETFRTLKRLAIEGQFLGPQPIEEGPDSITFLLEHSDLDPETRNWLTKEYTSGFNSGMESRYSITYPDDNQRNSYEDNMFEVSPMTLANSVLDGPPKGSSTQLKNLGSVFSQQLSAADIENLGNWHWDVFQYNSETTLFPFVIKMFDRFNFLEMYRISPLVFVQFLCAVRDGYKNNPYHNFHHGVDVCQTVYCILTTMEGADYLSSLQKFALLISALTHDIHHPGLNNVFQVNAQTHLAITYNDQSVLENYHCAKTFGILGKPESNILSNLGKDEYRSVRKLIISAILSTDMTCHFDMLKRFNSRLEARWTSSNQKSPRRPSHKSAGHGRKIFLNAADRELVMSVFLHGADISNPCKSWPVTRQWSDRITQEFLSQGDKERSCALPVSPTYDRRYADQAQFSLDFIDFIVAPMFVAISQFLPKMQIACNQLRSNRRRWEGLLVKKIDQSEMPYQKKLEEHKKWTRRMESFHQTMMPHSKSTQKRTKSARRGSIRVTAQGVEDYIRGPNSKDDSSRKEQANKHKPKTPNGEARGSDKRRYSTPSVLPSFQLNQQDDRVHVRGVYVNISPPLSPKNRLRGHSRGNSDTYMPHSPPSTPSKAPPSPSLTPSIESMQLPPAHHLNGDHTEEESKDDSSVRSSVRFSTSESEKS